MSLNYTQAHHLCHELQPVLAGCSCQGVVALAPRSFVLTFTRGKQSYFLLLCLQEPFLRFHLSEPANTSQVIFQGQVPFVKELSKYLPGKTLTGCELLNADRILALSFRHGNDSLQLLAEFFPRRPNCYLLDQDNKILASLNPLPGEQLSYTLPPKRPAQPDTAAAAAEACTSVAIAKHYAALEAAAAFQQGLRHVLGSAQKLCKRAGDGLQQRRDTLAGCQNWPAVQHEGQLLQANLFRLLKGQAEITVEDWEQEGKQRLIALDPWQLPQAQVAKYFQRARKLRLGIVHAEKQQHLAEEELNRRRQQLQEASAIGNLVELMAFCRRHGFKLHKEQGSPAAKKAAAVKPYHHYVTEAGLHIWVGKSAKDNDQLTFQLAKGSDWWLHAHNHSGSHVVLRCPKDVEPDAASIGAAAELALRYSKANDKHSGEVCLTQVKYLKRVKGTPGKVMLSKHKVLQAVLDEARWQRLKELRLG